MNSPQPTPNLARASVLSSKSNASQDPFVLNTQIKSDRRSKLHTSSVVHWLRKRHHDTANSNYLMMPNEQKQHSEVKDVFKIFDADNSGKLQMGEFYDMLKHAGITIDKEELRQFYKKVDLDNDIALDFQEFKNCTLSDEANFHFAKMMEKIRLESRGMDSKAQQEQQPRVNAPGMRRESSSKTFQPRTFGNLLNYLTYENKKQSLKDFVQDKQNDLGEKFRKFEELLDLHMGKDIYAERLSTRFEPKSMSAERTSILSRDSIMFKNSSFKPPRIDSEAMITEPDFNGNTTPSSSSSDDDNTRDAEQMELIKELDGISRKARQSAREEFFVRTNAKKRHTMVNTGSVDQQSKRSSFASRDSIMSNRPHTRNFEETTKPSKFRSQRLMTAAADDETIKCSLAIGLPSNEKLPTGSKDEVIQTSDEYREKLDKQKSVRNTRNAKVTSVEKIAGWTFNPNTPKREFIIKSQTENNGKLSLPKFKGSLQIPARTLETSQGKTRIRLASPQGFTNSARDLFASPKMGSTLQKVYTPNLRLAYSGKVDFGDQSPEKDISAFSRQFTTTTGPMSTDRDRIQTEPSTADAVSAIRNTRFSFKQPSKMPKNYTIGTPESGSLSGRSHGSQKASKPNTPSSQGKDHTREKDKKVSIFAKPMQSAVGAVRE